jgi:hypothetical protein
MLASSIVQHCLVASTMKRELDGSAAAPTAFEAGDVLPASALSAAVKLTSPAEMLPYWFAGIRSGCQMHSWANGIFSTGHQSPIDERFGNNII